MASLLAVFDDPSTKEIASATCSVARFVLMAPFSVEEAANAINGLKAARLLNGFRGIPSLHGKGLAETASALSRIAWNFQDDLDELEINPILVGTNRAVAVDVLLQTGKTDSGH